MMNLAAFESEEVEREEGRDRDGGGDEPGCRGKPVHACDSLEGSGRGGPRRLDEQLPPAQLVEDEAVDGLGGIGQHVDRAPPRAEVADGGAESGERPLIVIEECR